MVEFVRTYQNFLSIAGEISNGIQTRFFAMLQPEQPHSIHLHAFVVKNGQQIKNNGKLFA